MVNIIIIQTDNRPELPYLALTQKVNKKVCKHFGYQYLFLDLDNTKYNLDPKTTKLYIINDFIQKTSDDILVFLDSDAWIQNGFWLNEIIHDLLNDNSKNGCFSRDPYVKHNTFINSGSFILKMNNFTKEMYRNIIFSLDNDIKNNVFNKFGWEDQFYISNFVFENKEKFNIFIPHILNTPLGEVLRHNWWKSKKMYDDLFILINEPIGENTLPLFDFQQNYDKEDFPNKIVHGYEYVV